MQGDQVAGTAAGRDASKKEERERRRYRVGRRIRRVDKKEEQAREKGIYEEEEHIFGFYSPPSLSLSLRFRRPLMSLLSFLHATGTGGE